MYPAHYVTKYSDKFGDEVTTTINDGKMLKMVVRNVEFIGHFFTGLKPVTIDNEKLDMFSFEQGYLCSFSVDCEIPLPVVFGENIQEGSLHIFYRDHRVRLLLNVGEYAIKSTGSYRDDEGFMGDELSELEILLPANSYIKSCASCRFACESPLGYSTFGELGCFRNVKSEYSKVNNKHELIKIFDKVTEYVQEIHLCPEFQPNLKFLNFLKSKAAKS